MAVIKLTDDSYLSTTDGIVITKEQALRILPNATKYDRGIHLSDTVQSVGQLGYQTIQLRLQGSNGNIAPTKGFLITVYLSGTDGTLTRMYQNEIIDIADNSVLRGGFGQYITLELDK